MPGPGDTKRGPYENPAYKGLAGEGFEGKKKPESPGGSKSGEYDNAPNTAPGSKQAGAKDKFEQNARPEYDNIKLDKDFGVSGHGKQRKP